MKNRIVGVIIIVFALLMGFMTWLFNRALTEIVNDSCSHGPTCPMWGSIGFQTNLSLGMIGAVLLLGIYFLIFPGDEKPEHAEKSPLHFRKIEKKTYEKEFKELSGDEKKVLEKIIESQGTIFQSELADKENSKVKITRILDRLEGKGLIERKRRGMTNIVL